MRKIRVGTCPVLLPRWSVGDRVKRRFDVYNQSSPFQHGAVVLRYSIMDTGSEYSQDYPELYAVRWDDGRFEKALFHHGLEFGEPYWQVAICEECGKKLARCPHGYSKFVQMKVVGELD